MSRCALTLVLAAAMGLAGLAGCSSGRDSGLLPSIEADDALVGRAPAAPSFWEPTLRDLPVLERAPVPDMFFRHWGVNPTVETAAEPVSTFSVDVDTASYALVRSYLERGHLPPEAAVRVEELVNAFDYGYASEPGETFTVQAEAVPSPTRPGFHLLHLGLQARRVERHDRKPANLVFVIDVSGSMGREDRLGLVKRSLRMLVDQLGADDRVGIVVYGSGARVVLESTPASRRWSILSAIDRLEPAGSTHLQRGLELGYAMAARHLSLRRVNRVILCSDGVANTGLTDPDAILDTVADEVERGVTLSVIGVGMGNFDDALMERLADRGDGSYHYVDGLEEARRVFVEAGVGTLERVARDAKVQLELDPRAVERYRLIGYENRMLEREDFEDDRVDAGDVGAGHAVTALYEVALRDPSRGLGRLRLRWTDPASGEVHRLERELPASIVRASFRAGSSPTRLSAVVAAFAEKLRGSYWSRPVSYEQLLVGLEELRGGVDPRQVEELRRLVERAQRLDRRVDRFSDSGPVERMSFDRVPVLR